MDKRGPIVRDAKWLEHLRTEPCVISGLHASDSEFGCGGAYGNGWARHQVE